MNGFQVLRKPLRNIPISFTYGHTPLQTVRSPTGRLNKIVLTILKSLIQWSLDNLTKPNSQTLNTYVLN